MQNVVKIIAGIIIILLAFSILKNLFGLLIGVALAAGVYLGATKLLEKK
ncbi:hypothetical protein [Sphingomicrobium sediminis]|uniref:Uncharacterized protein n=1 Tax=Sphingomicrobium sediminis TaxID=2950949 RepID=A0A9X2J1S5_9SPHN|nr:hypothetical protein [Sphingomicrobium sediminis]MCM8557034.1 hypothetical protein [Sphingomicrobium sediminis]